MKSKILMLIIGLILLSSVSYGAVFNTTYDSYDYTGTWADPLNYIDSDWATYSTATSTSYFYFNYTNPNSNKANWIVKDQQGTQSLSINDIGDLNPLQLQVVFSDASNYVKYNYYDGSSWVNLIQTYTSSSSIFFNEQIIQWNSTQEELLYYNFSDFINSSLVEDLAHSFNGELINFNSSNITNSTTTDEGFYLGSAMDFNGIDDYISIDSLNLNSNSFSISYWSNFYENSGDDQYGTSNYVFYSTSEGNYILQYYKRFVIAKFKGVSYYFSDTKFLWNNYNHFILKGSPYNLTHSELNLFINGVEAIQDDPVYMEIGLINLDQIGSRTTYFIEGGLDELRIFNRVIDEKEIYSLYHFNSVEIPSEYTTFYAEHFITNATYTDFTINWLNKDTLESGTSTTTEGFIPLLLNDLNDYEINISGFGFADQTNLSFDSTLENYTFKVYDNNSVSLYVYDEETGYLIDSINTTMYYALNGYTTILINDTGNFYLSELEGGLWNFRFSTSGYYDRYYYLTMQNSQHYFLNSYLINTTIGQLRNFMAQCTGSAVRNATISVYKLINGNYVSVGQRITDYTGLAPFYLNPATTYKIIITTEDYDTFISEITPSSTPISFDLCGEESNQPFNWTTIYDQFSYLIDNESIIPAELHTFNLQATSPTGSIQMFGLSYDSYSNYVTGSSAGGTTSIIVNLTNATGIIPVTYYFNISGYDQYVFTKNYRIEGFGTVGNYSYSEVFTDYKDEIPDAWRYIIITIIALMLMIALYKFIDPLFNAFAGFFVFVTFVYLEWITVTFLVPMGALLIVFYLIERGN